MTTEPTTKRIRLPEAEAIGAWHEHPWSGRDRRPMRWAYESRNDVGLGDPFYTGAHTFKLPGQD